MRINRSKDGRHRATVRVDHRMDFEEVLDALLLTLDSDWPTTTTGGARWLHSYLEQYGFSGPERDVEMLVEDDDSEEARENRAWVLIRRLFPELTPRVTDLDRWFPSLGPCAVCGDGRDARHRLIDTIREQAALGMGVDDLAREYGRPVEAIRAATAHQSKEL